MSQLKLKFSKYLYLFILLIINCNKKPINEKLIIIDELHFRNKIFTLYIKNATKDTITLNFFLKDVEKNLDSNTKTFTSYIVPNASTNYNIEYDTIRFYNLENKLITKKYYLFFIEPYTLTPPKSSDVPAFADTLPTAECPMRLYFGRKRLLRLKYQNFITKDTNAKYKSFYNVHNYTKLGKLNNEEIIEYTFTEKDYLLADTIIN